MHTVIGATAICGGLLFIAFLSIRWLLSAEYRAGRRAYDRNRPLNPHWPVAMQDGWSAAWGESLRARLGYRSAR